MSLGVRGTNPTTQESYSQYRWVVGIRDSAKIKVILTENCSSQTPELGLFMASTGQCVWAVLSRLPFPRYLLVAHTVSF